MVIDCGGSANSARVAPSSEMDETPSARLWAVWARRCLHELGDRVEQPPLMNFKPYFGIVLKSKYRAQFGSAVFSIF